VRGVGERSTRTRKTSVHMLPRKRERRERRERETETKRECVCVCVCLHLIADDQADRLLVELVDVQAEGLVGDDEDRPRDPTRRRHEIICVQNTRTTHTCDTSATAIRCASSRTQR
jgi:hypothetical protein